MSNESKDLNNPDSHSKAFKLYRKKQKTLEELQQQVEEREAELDQIWLLLSQDERDQLNRQNS